MIKIINKLLFHIKGEEFKLDENLPLGYVLRILYNQLLSLIWGMLRFRTLKMVFVNPHSVVRCRSKISFGKNLRIGRNCYVDALSEKGLICGDNVSIGYSTHIELTGSLRFLGRGMRIGNNVGLGTHGHYGSGKGFLEIGDDTICGNYVSIHPENHIYADKNIPIRNQGVSGIGVKIGKNCWIGAKVTILDGTVIGDGCIVAAGAVVRGSFPDNVILAGVPAKIIKRL